MRFGGQGEFELANRFRACAARLRSVAAMAPGDPITPDYVEELAREFDRCAEALELYPAGQPVNRPHDRQPGQRDRGADGDGA